MSGEHNRPSVNPRDVIADVLRETREVNGGELESILTLYRPEGVAIIILNALRSAGWAPALLAAEVERWQQVAADAQAEANAAGTEVERLRAADEQWQKALKAERLVGSVLTDEVKRLRGAIERHREDNSGLPVTQANVNLWAALLGAVSAWEPSDG